MSGIVAVPLLVWIEVLVYAAMIGILTQVFNHFGVPSGIRAASMTVLLFIAVRIGWGPPTG